MHEFSDNRVLRDTGARYPIFNAPVGYFARSGLAGAVSAAGGMGLMEMTSTGVEKTAREAAIIRARTENPFGQHMFISALRDRLDEVLDWALGQATFLASCAGNPKKVMPRVLETGIPLYHQVGSLDEALKAVDAGVSGLIVEGAEAGGLRSTRSPHLFTLLQQIGRRVDVPLVAAGGIVDGIGMAAAFALGAEGVMMGTRFMSCAESPVHENWKQAVADCDVTLNIDPGMPNLRMRVVRNELSESVERGDVDPKGNPYAGPFMEAFRDGRLDRAMVGCGESATLVTEIKTAAEIIDETMTGFWREIDRLAALRA
ncbi:MAG: enoyl-[acyl-carrier protein] reductase [Actinomycetota bacterium]|jgi:enoyl-[acyl-carrier protein] reductase II